MDTLASWAEPLAQALLQEALPRRWAHSQGVAARARGLAPVLGADADLIEAAAWLHDIGYAPGLALTGLHQLDGARYLRDAAHADALLCRLVAHHSCEGNPGAWRWVLTDPVELAEPLTGVRGQPGIWLIDLPPG